MKAAKHCSILWFAHVLPLYAIMFRLTPSEALDLLAGLELADWVDGDKKNLSMRDIVKGIHPHFFRQWAFQPGTVGMNACDVPDMA